MDRATLPNHTDEELITEYRTGNLEAFEYLISRHTNHIYSYINRMIGNADESRDLTQETFVKAWKNLRKFDESKKFKTWLFTIARNTTFDWLRKKHPIIASRLDDDSSFIENVADTELLPNELFEQKELSEWVSNTLQLLSPENRSILLLKHTEELTFEEIAVILDEPMNTVKSRYRRALQVMKKQLLERTK